MTIAAIGISLDRYNAATDSMEQVTFCRGEYVRVFLSSNRSFFGEIAGISQARKEVRIDGAWYAASAIYKAARPVPAQKRLGAVKLSRVVARVNATWGRGLTDADRIA